MMVIAAAEGAVAAAVAEALTVIDQLSIVCAIIHPAYMIAYAVGADAMDMVGVAITAMAGMHTPALMVGMEHTVAMVDTVGTAEELDTFGPTLAFHEAFNIAIQTW
jgi:hypothetical protein